MNNYRNYQGGGSALIAIGAVFLGILLLSLKQYILEKDYMGITILSVLSLICIVPGVFVKLWAHKKEKAAMLCSINKNVNEKCEIVKKENVQPETPTKEEDEKFNKTIGKWMLIIAGIILCLNVLCRVVDAVKSKDYVQVIGTVTSTETISGWHAGKRSYSYGVNVEYPMDFHSRYISESYSFHMFSKGDTVPVLYLKGTGEAYIAKKDWMTGAYIPVNRWYNVPFVISIVLFIGGFRFLHESRIAKQKITTGEKKEE